MDGKQLSPHDLPGAFVCSRQVLTFVWASSILDSGLRLEWKDDFEVLKEAIKHIEAQRVQYEYEVTLKEMGSKPEFENRRISRSMVKHRQYAG